MRNLSYKRCRSFYVYSRGNGGDLGERRNALSSRMHTVCTMHRTNRNIVYCTVVRKRGYSKTKKRKMSWRLLYWLRLSISKSREAVRTEARAAIKFVSENGPTFSLVNVLKPGSWSDSRWPRCRTLSHKLEQTRKGFFRKKKNKNRQFEKLTEIGRTGVAHITVSDHIHHPANSLILERVPAEGCECQSLNSPWDPAEIRAIIFAPARPARSI